MAIAHVQTVTATSTSSATVTAASFAVGSGSNRSMVAFLLFNDQTGSTPGGSTVIFNTSENLTFRVRARLNYATDDYMVSEGWSLDNPSNATADVVGTISETVTNMAMTVSEYTGANNGVGSNTGSGTGTSTGPTVTFTTGASDSLIVGGIAQQLNVSGPYTPGSGVTERADGTAISMSYWMGEKAASAGSDTINATSAGSFRWAMAAFELKAAAATAVSNPPRRQSLMFWKGAR